MAGYGRPSMGSGGAERTAQKVEEAKTRRQRGTAAAMAALREGRGKKYKPGEGKKMAEALRNRSR